MNLYKFKKVIYPEVKIQAIITLIYQLIYMVSALHDEGYIHSNLHPVNICFGLGNNGKNLYFVDLHHAYKYMDKKYRHI